MSKWKEITGWEAVYLHGLGFKVQWRPVVAIEKGWFEWGDDCYASSTSHETIKCRVKVKK